MGHNDFSVTFPSMPLPEDFINDGCVQDRLYLAALAAWERVCHSILGKEPQHDSSIIERLK